MSRGASGGGGGAIALLAALSGAVAVAMGAAGSHALSGRAAEWARTGAEFQMIHATAALVAIQMRGRWAAIALVGGAAVFSGTLYLMALGWPRWLGAVTPAGGVAMIAGWLLLAVRAVRR